MKISGLYYITSDHKDAPALTEQVAQACRNGVRWVQLRMKDASPDAVEETARELLPVCRRHGAWLIINDDPAVALSVGAGGVHLGLDDMAPAAARALLGKGYLIGGTANSFARALQLAEAGVDYIGLGPFRFTATKTKLGPLLGLEGVRNTVRRLRASGILLPVLAIGGIRTEDVAGLAEAGVAGVAVSSAIALAGDPGATTRVFITGLAKNTFHEQADHSR